MPATELDLDPVQHITADAIGQPGQRVFYLQGWRGSDPKPVTLIIEKIQLQSLSLGIEQMISEIANQKPELALPSADYDPDRMRIMPPVDPLFRAGDMGIGYDADRDRIVVLVRAVPAEGEDPKQTGAVRFWCTRAQARILSAWAAEVIERGRPICAQCGQPMEPEGHFCPKKNGNKKK